MALGCLALGCLASGGLALLIFLRVPIGISLGISGVLTFLYTKGSFMAMAQTYYDSVDSFPLMAVPLFFLAGSIMEMGGISRRLVNVAEAMIGQIRGGLGLPVERDLHWEPRRVRECFDLP